MSRWKNALAGAAGAVANVGVQALDRQIQLEQTIAAEQRAADLKLDMAERMAAADEMRRNAAAVRFTNVVQAKLGEEIPVEPGGVDKTGLTRDSAIAPTDDKAGANFAQTPEQLAVLEKNLKTRLADPNATPEQRAEAAEVLDALERQKKAQGELNVKGKTRKRTALEARDAALEETSATDLSAFTAGRSAWKDAMNDERSDKKDAAASREKQLDRESLERRTEMGVDQRRDAAEAETARRTEADQLRYKAVQERIEAMNGGKGGKATAMMQNVAFLEQRGYSAQQIEKFIFNAKDTSSLEKAFKLLQADKFGDLTPMQALDKVQELGKAAGEPAAAGGEKIRTWNPTTRKFE